VVRRASDYLSRLDHSSQSGPIYEEITRINGGELRVESLGLRCLWCTCIFLLKSRRSSLLFIVVGVKLHHPPLAPSASLAIPTQKTCHENPFSKSTQMARLLSLGCFLAQGWINHETGGRSAFACHYYLAILAPQMESTFMMKLRRLLSASSLFRSSFTA